MTPPPAGTDPPAGPGAPAEPRALAGPDALAGPGALGAAVLRIRDGRGEAVGMGFLVSADVALTCAHVVSAALGGSGDEPPPPGAGVQVDLPLLPASGADGTRVTARVEQWTAPGPSGAGDVAVLRLPAPLPGARPVRLVAAGGEDIWGHPVRVFGLPEGRPGGVWHAGVLRGSQAAGWVQADLAGAGYPVSGGFSGSPVWDEHLAGVVGMVAVAEAGKPSASYLVPTGRLADAWPELRGLLLPAPPFRGLAAFRENDAPVFHGRREEGREVARMVAAHRWVTVVGPSGSGKSSLAMAGVAPSLRAAGTVPVVMRPDAGSSPLSALAAALLPLLEPDLPETTRLLRIRPLVAELTRPGGFAQVVGRLAGAGSDEGPEPAAGSDEGPEPGAASDEVRLLVVVDQLEELLAAEPEAAEKLADVLFTDALPPSVRVLTTLRADFLEAALAHPRIGAHIGQQVYVLRPMSAGRLREVITAPVDAIPGAGYEENLPDRILADTGHAPGALPLLGLTLDLLWRRRQDGVLTHDAYDRLGRVPGALGQYADRAWAESVSEDDEPAARRLFTQLIRVPLGSAPVTRRVAARTELGEAEWRVAQRLAATRLLVVSRGAEGTETVELSHDALITGWARSAEWVARDRSFLAWRETLRHDMERWESGGRATDLLPTPAMLTAARPWQRTRGPDLTVTELDYLARGRAHRRAQARRRRSLVSGLALAVVLTLVLGTLLYGQHQRGEENAAHAESRHLATASADEAGSDPGLSAMLAIAAYRTSPTQEARDRLLQQYLRQIPSGRIDSGFQGPAADFRTSRDGEVLLVGSSSGRATLFVHAATGRMRMWRLPSEVHRMYPLVAADGTRAVTVNSDGSVDWYPVTPDADRITRPVHHLPPARGLPRPHYSDVNATLLPETHASLAALSPDGRLLAYATSSGFAWRSLDTGAGGTVPLPPHAWGDVWFGTDDRTLLATVDASGGRSRIVAVDRTTGRTRPVTPGADQELVSGDGSAVAACRESGLGHVTLDVTRVRDGKRQGRVYTGHDLKCGMEATDEAGHRIVLGPDAGAADAASLRLLDLDQGTVVSRFSTAGAPARLVSDHGVPLLVTFDETRVGYARVPAAPGTVDAAKEVLTDDGRNVIVAVKGGVKGGLKGGCALQLRSAQGGAELLAQARRPEPCWDLGQGDSLQLDAGGRLLAVRDGENTVSVHDVSTLRRITRVTTAEPRPRSAGNGNFACFFDRTGRLVTVSGTLIQQWDPHTGRRLAQFDANVFHPRTEKNGTLELFVGRYPAPDSVAVVAWGDPVVHVLDLTSGHTTAGMRLGSDTHGVQFDPGGHHLVVLRSGGTLELWRRDPLRRELPALTSVEDDSDSYVAHFVDDQGRFLLAAQNAVRIYRVGQGAYEDSYEFGTSSGTPNGPGYTFLSASGNGKSVIYAGAGGAGGPLPLDPALWQRALCRAIGFREFTAEERRGLPVHVPAQPVCAGS
ncbi:serine protease [Streptomyces sp. TS71-3]|uniref:S1 family peptidase n=1 Tax=Streptomyces sp. TS71-3 TaxID=2733862 RepID=UPI001B2A6B5A|nr:serine protease [Streptomyces sp. TS71-3]GHJ39785.1 hypothetical protein Sm713_53940 [Streptomyces sp. TS71-3]